MKPKIRKQQIIKSFAVVLTAALLGGCSGFGATTESLLSPPKLTESQNSIYQALVKSIGDQPEMVYPRSGEYRSAFVMYNLDDEETEEAIVFYRTSEAPAGESGLRMNFLDREEGEWVSVFDRSLAGTEVESLSFVDFGAGEYMVLKTSALSQAEQAVNVLSYQSGEVTELYRGNFAFLEATDLDNNGAGELFLINYDATISSYMAHIVTLYVNENKITAFGDVSSLPLTNAAQGGLRYARQRLGETDNILFIDYSSGEGEYGTQALRCYNNNLTLADGEFSSISRRSNGHTPVLHSTDIDGDGRIEVPSTTPLPGYENLPIPEQLYSVDWYTMDDSSLVFTKKSSSYVSMGREFMFYIPARWQGVVTVEKNGAFTIFERYQLDPEPLLTVYLSTDGSPPDAGGDWVSRGTSGAASVYVNNSESSDPMALTDDELNSLLITN